MSWSCSGRECKLGWGFDESLHRLIPVEEHPPNVTSEILEEQDRSWIWNVSCEEIASYSRIIYYLEPSIKKDLDFHLVFDEKEYWYLQWHIYKRTEKCEKLPEYPLTCSHYVSRIDYGVDLIVIFPKSGLTDEKEKVLRSFEDRILDDVQEKISCKVLINYNEVRELTLKELMKFRKELEGDHPEFDIPIRFYYEEVDQKFREVKVNNQTEFGKFLSYLYCTYRKIELKTRKAGYPDVIPDSNFEEKSFVDICVNLSKVKEKYKSGKEKDFFELYSVLKKLFYCYLDYIKYALDNLNTINEGDFLPGNWEEFKPWLCQLNKWFPVKINEHWHSCMDSVILTDDRNDILVQKLKATEKLRNTNIIISRNLTEPIVATEKNPKGSKFGFVNMSFAETTLRQLKEIIRSKWQIDNEDQQLFFFNGDEILGFNLNSTLFQIGLKDMDEVIVKHALLQHWVSCLAFANQLGKTRVEHLKSRFAREGLKQLRVLEDANFFVTFPTFKNKFWEIFEEFYEYVVDMDECLKLSVECYFKNYFKKEKLNMEFRSKPHTGFQVGQQIAFLMSRK